MSLIITALYTGLLAIVGTILSFYVGNGRIKTGISLGTGDSTELLERVRRHGNFTEYVPLALILLAILEINGTGTTTLHVLGTMLLVGRVVHPLGLTMDNMKQPARAIGALLTTIVIVVSAGMAIWQYVGLMLAR